MIKERHMRDLGIDEAPGGNRTNGRTTNPLLAGRVLFGEAMENGVEPPEELEPGILLKGKVHHVFAAGLGETTLCGWRSGPSNAGRRSSTSTTRPGQE